MFNCWQLGISHNKWKCLYPENGKATIFFKEPVYQCTTGFGVLVGIPLPGRGVAPSPGVWQGRPMARPLMLTIVVDAIDETDTHLSVVVGHKDDVEDVLTVGVQFSKLLVHRLQSLDGRGGGLQLRRPRN